MSRRRKLTSTETAEMLGVNRSTLWRWRQDGLLEPIGKSPDGVLLYDCDAVERLQKSRARSSARRRQAARRGAIAAQVYRMFEAGSTDRDVVMEMELAPKVVAELRRQYTLPAAWLVEPALQQRLRQLLQRYGLRVQTPEELYAVLETTLSNNAQLNAQLLLTQAREKGHG